MTKRIATYLLIIIFSGALTARAQEVEGQKGMTKKSYPAVIQSAISEALVFFPELNDIKIDFVFKKKIKNAVMQAQPRIRTLFKKKENRTYKIKISRELQLQNNSVPIEELPNEILVGWLAHELGHVMDYLDRSSFQMIGFGAKYLTSRNFLINAEYEADKHAIEHGCADLIIKTKNFILNHQYLPEDYKARIDKLYLSPEEVRHMEEELHSGG